MRKTVSLHLFLLLLFGLCSFLPTQVLAVQHTWTQAFQQQVDNWMQSLSKKDKQFASWNEAETSVKELGANSHQWVVTVQKKGENLGYLVVAERPDSASEQIPAFVLLEYGLGEYVLFNEQYAPQDGDSKQVYDGLASYWEQRHNHSVALLDAKSGERYPREVKPSPAVMPTIKARQLLSDEESLRSVKVLTKKAIDPFDRIDWLLEGTLQKEKKKPTEWDKLIARKGDSPFVITASLFNDQVVAPFTIGTIHTWKNDVTYVGVWDEGLRFLPGAYLDKIGYVFQPK